MLLTLACLVAVAAAAPHFYDRRQDGELNISADLSNVVLLIAYPQKMSAASDLLDFLKNNKGNTRNGGAGLQERADHVMETFVEPNTPYQVEIGSRNAEGDGRAVEVVIAGRRRLENEPQNEDSEEIKLLGATEQCGPDAERDPVTLTCRFRAQLDIEPQPDTEPQPQPDYVPETNNLTPEQTPEVVPS